MNLSCKNPTSILSVILVWAFASSIGLSSAADADGVSSTTSSDVVAAAANHVRRAPEEEGDNGIIGGQIVNSQEFPFFVQGWSCGGMLVAPDVVLSAGHCFGYRGFMNNESVLVGSWRWNDDSNNVSQWRKIVDGSARLHPNYTEYATDSGINDVMLLKIEAVTLPNLKPVALNSDLSEPTNREKLMAIGYGSTTYSPWDDKATYPDELYKVNLKAVDYERCMSSFTSANETKDWVIPPPELILCASEIGKGVCFGDSGGPLLRMVAPGNATTLPEWEVVGITSYGQGCALYGFPGVFANVAGLYDWIMATMDELSDFGLPTRAPTRAPTRFPTLAPTNRPTVSPTQKPTVAPTLKTCLLTGETCPQGTLKKCCTKTNVCLATTKKCGNCVKKGKKCKVKGDCCKPLACKSGKCA